MKKSKFSLSRHILLVTSYWLLVTGLWGCATYKFQKGQSPYDKGYIVSRDGYSILEYTVGKDSPVPGIKLAKERFQRRKDKIEHYYKKMDYIESRFKQYFINPPIYFLKFMGGVFRLPFIAISDYRYAHNPKYREKIKKREAEQDSREEARINKLKEQLNTYIQNDLAKEPASIEEPKIQALAMVKEPEEVISQPEVIKPAPEEAMPKIEEKIPEKIAPEEEPSPQIIKEARPQEVPTKVSTGLAVAIIKAKPQKGYSPLRVQFNAKRSYSKQGKITSYAWDFGDGDTSSKVNPVNTYYSGSSEPQYFTVTLTVQDDKGNTAGATTTIEVINR